MEYWLLEGDADHVPLFFNSCFDCCIDFMWDLAVSSANPGLISLHLSILVVFLLIQTELQLLKAYSLCIDMIHFNFSECPIINIDILLFFTIGAGGPLLHGGRLIVGLMMKHCLNTVQAKRPK